MALEQRLAAPRIARELRTVEAMLAIACRARHGDAARDGDGLCVACAALRQYARKRLALCPFAPDKPTCANCKVHCYGRTQREAMRAVMRCAGPRMLWRHPVLAVLHLVDGRREAPATAARTPAREAQSGSPGPCKPRVTRP